MISRHVISSVSFFFPPLSISLQQQEQDPTNLYISNLPLSMDEQELENMLKHFGQVISTRILRDSSGSSRGVGFARLAPLCSPASVSLEFTKHGATRSALRVELDPPRPSEPFQFQQEGFVFLLKKKTNKKKPTRLTAGTRAVSLTH